MTTSLNKKASPFQIFLEFSMPLILGVLGALVWANLDNASYEAFIKFNFIEGFKLFSHSLEMKFLVNDMFMVLFFAIAAVEITRAFQPGGALSSIRTAINPLFGTIGGIAGPVGVFFILLSVLPLDGVLTGGITLAQVANGWGIPTATDIALAWLATSLILGKKHPAIAFLLFLAIIDDAVGLVIIAVFYPSPDYPVEPLFLGLNVLAIVIAYLLRRNHVHNIWAYIVLAGIPSWLGLLLAHLHPALAFVIVVPFMPDTVPEHLKNQDSLGASSEKQENKTNKGFFTPSLTKFEHTFEIPVDIGLFFFGLVNAGVGLSSINVVTWLIFLSLFLGKAIGIFGFSMLASLLGYSLPEGIDKRTLLIIGIIAGMGLTVSLFITGQAYTNPVLQAPAKMGALFSALLAFVAWLLARIFKLKRVS